MVTRAGKKEIAGGESFQLRPADAAGDAKRSSATQASKRTTAIGFSDELHLGGANSASTLRFDAADPVWARVLERCTNRERAELTLEFFRDNFEIDKSLMLHAAILVWATATGKDGRDTEGLITPVQAHRALEKMGSLPPATRTFVEGLFERARSIAEHAVILKALAACQDMPDGPELRFELEQRTADRIRGQSLEWIIDKTTTYGLMERIGEAQSHDEYCGLTVASVAEAEYRPSIALDINLDPRDARDQNSVAARHQRSYLEIGKQKIKERDFDREMRNFDQQPLGTKLSTYVHEALSRLGVEYHNTHWGAGDDKQLIMGDLERLLRLGLKLPLITNKDGFPPHAELLVDCTTIGGPRSWRIHDPWTGRSRFVSDDQLANGDPKDDHWRIASMFIPY